MKIIFTILIMCVCTFANAQTKVTFDYYSKETLDAIGTTKEQQEKIAEIKKNTDAKVSEIKNNSSLSEEQKKAEYKKAYSPGAKLYFATLTPQQNDKLKALQLKIAKQNAANGFRPKIDSNFKNSYYDMRMDLFQNLPVTQKSIVFLGNSITERGMWHELFPGKVIMNRGIGGDNTFGILSRLDPIIESKPEKIFLMIGINDIARGFPVDLIVSNYKKIIQRLIAGTPGTKIYVQSTLPMNDDLLKVGRYKGKADTIKQYNKELYKLSVENKLIYVNLYDSFHQGDFKLNPDLTKDGIHINPKGYVLWTNYLREKKYL